MLRKILIVFGLPLVLISNANAVPIINGSFEDISGMSGSGTFRDGIPVGWSFTGKSSAGITVSAICPFWSRWRLVR